MHNPIRLYTGTKEKEFDVLKIALGAKERIAFQHGFRQQLQPGFFAAKGAQHKYSFHAHSSILGTVVGFVIRPDFA